MMELELSFPHAKSIALSTAHTAFAAPIPQYPYPQCLSFKTFLITLASYAVFSTREVLIVWLNDEGVWFTAREGAEIRVE